MNSSDWAYLAGFIDGEGCIRGTQYGDRTYLRISIGQRDGESLRTLWLKWGVGTFRQMSSGQWLWSIGDATSVEWILEGILPYLILKRPQAELALIMLSSPVREREHLAQELSRLKHV